MVSVNGERLWSTLTSMAAIGATGRGGSRRLALTDEDQSGRELFLNWCRSAGYPVSYDRAGNLFVRRPGQDNDLDPLVVGSHLDTQPTGGRFDGILGVLAGLEVCRSLDDLGLETLRPVEIAVWMNEEGARFQPAMMGSGVYAGILDFDRVMSTTDTEGISVETEIHRLGYADGSDPRQKRIHGYLELHIEQGPVLEKARCVIGIVTGGQAIRWYDVAIAGEEAHAGPTPMVLRKDPVSAIPAVIDLVRERAAGDDRARATIGQLHAYPGSRNVIPGRVHLSVDLRHPGESALAEMDVQLRNGISEIGSRFRGLGITISETWHSPVVKFSEPLVEIVRLSARESGYKAMEMISGAGHDAFNIARKVPAAMIFIPCRDGISHNEREDVEPEHVTAGANVLMGAVLRAACS